MPASTLKVHIRTRGVDRSRDYRYFPFEPEHDWASDPLSSLCMVERPTLILRRLEDRVVLRATGIPSARVDAVGTAVRYSVAVETKASKDALRSVHAFVQAWLLPGTREKMGASLDSNDLEEWFTTPPSLRATREALRAATAYSGIQPTVERSTGAPIGLEVGGYDREENVRSLQAWVARLLREDVQPGYAAVVNLAEESRDFEAFRQASQPGLVLMMGNSSPIIRMERSSIPRDEGRALVGKAPGASLPLIFAGIVMLAVICIVLLP